MKKEYIVGIIMMIIALGVIFIESGEDKSEKPGVSDKKYKIDEIVPDEVISVKPIRVEGETFNDSMSKIDEGVREVAKKYHINYGETVIYFTAVYERVLYVKPRTGDNCTKIEIDHAENIIINMTNKSEK